jgi:hypothetical protein
MEAVLHLVEEQHARGDRQLVYRSGGDQSQEPIAYLSSVEAGRFTIPALGDFEVRKFVPLAHRVELDQSRVVLPDAILDAQERRAVAIAEPCKERRKVLAVDAQFVAVAS